MIMLVKYIVVCAVTSMVLWGYVAPDGSLPKIKSAQCIHQYSIAHHFYVADSASLEVLTCVCHCDNNTAAENYELARETHLPFCNAYIDNLQGFCFDVIQQGVSTRGCSKKGFAYCYNKLSAQNVYNFTALDLISSVYRIVLDQGQIIDVPAKKSVVTIHGSTFNVYTHGDPCVPPGTFLRSYVNIHATRDTILESCSNNEFGNKFTHTNQFILTNNFTYHKQLWSTIDYSKRVCVGQLSAFNSLDVSEYIDDHKKSCKIIPTRLKFSDVSETSAYLYEQMDLVLVKTEKRTTAKVMEIPTTTGYCSHSPPAIFLRGTKNLLPVKNPRHQYHVYPWCIKFCQSKTNCEINATESCYNQSEVVLTFLVCLLLPFMFSTAILVRRTKYCPGCTETKKMMKSSRKKFDVENDMVCPENCDQQSTAKYQRQRSVHSPNAVVNVDLPRDGTLPIPNTAEPNVTAPGDSTLPISSNSGSKVNLSRDTTLPVANHELGSKIHRSLEEPFTDQQVLGTRTEEVYLTNADECANSQGQESLNVPASDTAAKSLPDTQIPVNSTGTEPLLQLTRQSMPFTTYCSSEYEQVTTLTDLSEIRINEQLRTNTEDTLMKQSEENINVHELDSKITHTRRSTALYGSDRSKPTNVHKYETIPECWSHIDNLITGTECQTQMKYDQIKPHSNIIEQYVDGGSVKKEKHSLHVVRTEQSGRHKPTIVHEEETIRKYWPNTNNFNTAMERPVQLKYDQTIAHSKIIDLYVDGACVKKKEHCLHISHTEHSGKHKPTIVHEINNF